MSEEEGGAQTETGEAKVCSFTFVVLSQLFCTFLFLFFMTKLLWFCENTFAHFVSAILWISDKIVSPLPKV